MPLPLRENAVVKALAAVGLTIGTALVTLATITTLNVSYFTLGGGTQLDKVWSATTTINVDSLPAGIATSSNMTITGASLGDACSATVVTGDLAGTTSSASILCYVSSADTIRFIYRNTNATGSFDAGSSDVKATVISANP